MKKYIFLFLLLSSSAAIYFYLNINQKPLSIINPPPMINAPSIIKTHSWAGNGISLIFDHHAHSKISDGILSEEELVNLAISSKCDALAITDHSDNDRSVGWEQLQKMEALRIQNPNLILFTGLEVNIPSYNGREHATILTTPEHEKLVLPPLRIIAEQDNDGDEEKDPDRSIDQKLFNRLNGLFDEGANIVMIYNHPSRNDISEIENFYDLQTWSKMTESFIGFEGAPGHQRNEENGNYESHIKTVNRWDPMVSEVGGIWDQMIAMDLPFWGAIAGSDFHDTDEDYAPCSFSRTHINVETKDHSGILKALKAGTFWADHGQILNDFSFSAQIEGLETTLYPGAKAKFGSDLYNISLNINLERGLGALDQPLSIEIIGNCKNGFAETLITEIMPSRINNFKYTMEANENINSCFIRSRVRLAKSGEPDLLAYSNPIRFQIN